MAQVGVELETLVSEPDALTTRPPHVLVEDTFASSSNISKNKNKEFVFPPHNLISRNELCNNIINNYDTK